MPASTNSRPRGPEEERFLTQLRLVLNLLARDWDANLELLAEKLQKLCENFLQQQQETRLGLSTQREPNWVRDSLESIGIFQKARLAFAASLGLLMWNRGSIEPLGLARMLLPAEEDSKSPAPSSPSRPKSSGLHHYKPDLDEKACHLILISPHLSNDMENCDLEAWMEDCLQKALPSPIEEQSQAADAESTVWEDYEFVRKEDGTADAVSPKIYLRIDSLASSPSASKNIQQLMQNLLFVPTESDEEGPKYIGTEIVPVPDTEFQEVWDREALADWRRGASLLWTHGSLANPADSGNTPRAQGSDLLLGNLLGVKALDSIPVAASAVTMAKSAVEIGNATTNAMRTGADLLKRGAEIDAQIRTTVKTKVKTKVPEGTITTTKVSKVDSHVELPPPAAKPKKSGASAQKSEPTTPLEDPNMPLLSALEFAAPIVAGSAPVEGNAEPSLVADAAEASDLGGIPEEQATKLTDPEQSEANGEASAPLDDEAAGGSDVDGRRHDPEDDVESKPLPLPKPGALEKARKEFPCPEDYPDDKYYKAKFSRSVDDCIFSLKSADDALYKIISTHANDATPTFSVNSLEGRQLLSKLLVAIHRIVIMYICSENMIHQVTTAFDENQGVSVLSTGLDGVEVALGMLGPNPAALAAASILKAGRSMTKGREVKAAAKHQKKCKPFPVVLVLLSLTWAFS
ncbi:hypothetical protein DRE_02648 [Drechslerella stenobrocha 248]|uniref:Uncharacterized protein n=1 Tax=Drechslerella stenobrocha 248 TaxID=1043628 RepID=W7HWZ8_9PEZI|nr:hypothetical protein DRE_02648 [Drechslerella stenobrocha 248]